jgi:hypothetical protein
MLGLIIGGMGVIACLIYTIETTSREDWIKFYDDYNKAKEGRNNV